MAKDGGEYDYNRCLFSGGMRRHYHRARFKWLQRVISRLGRDLKMVELGCYDCRSLDMIQPWVGRYVGIDSDEAGGFELAQPKYVGRDDVTLIESASPDALERFGTGEFDVAISLETVEHIEPALVPAYLDQLARVTRGHLLVSVPNEMGPVFLAKYLGKLALYGGGERYSAKEALAALFRRTDRMERDQHKGFDYRWTKREIAKRFDIVSVEGLPATGLPPALSLTVGIVAKSRTAAPAGRERHPSAGG